MIIRLRQRALKLPTSKRLLRLSGERSGSRAFFREPPPLSGDHYYHYCIVIIIIILIIIIIND